MTWNGQEYVAAGHPYFYSSKYYSTTFSIYMSSADGIDWVVHSAPNEYYYTVLGRDNDETILGGHSGRIWRFGPNQANPEQWQLNTNATFYGSLWTGREYLLVGSSGTILSSVDGTRWSPHSPGPSPLPTFYDVAKHDDLIVIVGSNGQIRLSVVSPAPPPMILDHPASQTVAEGGLANLSVSATGQGLSYQWYRGDSGDTTNPVYDATGSTLSTLPINEETRYWVRVTDSEGLYRDSSSSLLRPLLDNRDFTWRWLNPLPSAITWNDVIHTSEGFIAVGADGRIMIQQNGAPWRVLESLLSEQTLLAIAGNGSDYVAVGEKGTLLVSMDGIHWQERFSHTTRNLNAVTWDGTRFVAVGDHGVTLSSANGLEWSRNDTTTTSSLLGIAGNGESLVAVGSSGSAYTSNDGISWTPRTSGTNRTLNDLIWDGTRFIACGNSGTIRTSADGIAWSWINSSTSRHLNRIRQDGDNYLAIGSFATIIESTDALTWSIVSDSTTNIDYNGFAVGDGNAVLVGKFGTLFTRLSGASWTVENQGSTTEILAMATGNGKIIAVDSGGTIRAAQGIDEPWQTVHTATSSSMINGVVHSPIGFVAVGNNGWLAHSSDGEIWYESTAPTSSNLLHVAWTGDSYLVLGLNGVILTSEDGISWAAQSSGVSSRLTGSASFGNMHIIVGHGGTVLASSNLIDWQAAQIPAAFAANNFSGIVHSGSSFLVYASHYSSGSSSIRTIFSQDGIAWEAGSSFTISSTIGDLIWNGERFMLVNTLGDVRTSDNGSHWLQRPSISGNPQTVTWFDGHWLVAGSNDLILAASDTEAIPRPSITTHPTSLRAALDEPVELAVIANGSQLRYRWFRGLQGDTSQPVPDAFGSTLSAPVEELPVNYWVRVSNGIGTWADSNVASVSVLPEIPTFAEWAAAGELTGSNAELNATPYNDGVPNLLKYAFNLNPSAPDRRTLTLGASDTEGLPGIEITTDSPVEVRLTIEFLRRRDSGLIYTPLVSENLVGWSPSTATGEVEIIDEAWERVTVVQEYNLIETPLMFGTVRVELPSNEIP